VIVHVSKMRSMNRFKQSDLETLSRIPYLNRSEWLASAQSSVSYLQANKAHDFQIIFASGKHVLVHGVLASNAKLLEPDADDLLQARFPSNNDCWVIQRSWGGGQEHRIYLQPPLDFSSSQSFVGGEKLVFQRDSHGLLQDDSPIELSQKLVHSLNLHFLPERKAYCKLDERGDIQDVIKLIDTKAKNNPIGLSIVLIDRKCLDQYMALSGTSLVLRFDFTRVDYDAFVGWGDIERYTKSESDLFYAGGLANAGSFVNGALIVRSNTTVEQMIQNWRDEEDHNKREYAKFKFFDRKNNKNAEQSCSPQFRVSYFVKSDLPH
jgi:hypothetical protein